jgi:TonB family protein
LIKLFFAVIILTISINIFPQKDTSKTYYPDGKLESLIPFENKVRQGEAIFYWETGNPKEKRSYVNDKVSGTVTTFYENGNIKEQYSIQDGKRIGVTSYYDSTGKSKEIVFEDGVRKGQDFLLVGEYREEDYQKLLAEWKERQLKKLDKNDDFSLPPVKDEEKIMDDDPAYYMNVEVMPEPIGGMNTIYKKLVYPEDAKKNKIEGTVKILAFIEKDGEVSAAQVVQGIGYGCDESARLAVYYTRFKPGLQKGKRVKVQMIVPIEFKLNSNTN